MREALDAVISLAFDKLSLEIVEAYTGEDNIASIQFLESTAFQYVETIVDEYSNGDRMKIYRLSNVG
jgi:RimJ/RimL family protein N-acetyltransferase